MRKAILLTLGIIIAVTSCSFIILYPKNAKPITETNPTEVSLRYPAEWNYRQSVNACGPYSAAAAIRILTGKDLSSEDISRDTPWRFRGYTLPFGVIAVLGRNHVSVDENIVALSDPEKLSWLQSKIAQQLPVIILGRKKGLLHYVTLVGYEKNAFYVYDSLEDKGKIGMTIDKNDSAPGNVTWTDAELMDFWNQGGVLGLYKNYAIIPRSS